MDAQNSLLQIFRQLKPENQSLLLAAVLAACIAENAGKQAAWEQRERDEGK